MAFSESFSGDALTPTSGYTGSVAQVIERDGTSEEQGVQRGFKQVSTSPLDSHYEKNSGAIFERLPVFVVGVAACAGIFGGAVTLIGWFTNRVEFTDWLGRGISMFPNAAMGSMACGVALILLASGNKRLLGWGRIPALGVALLGALTIIQHLTRVDLGIDQILVRSQGWGQTAANSPMRIGIPASISFFSLGTGLFLATLGRPFRRGANALALLSLSVASLSLVGYWFGADQLYGIAQYTGISWQTALLIAILAVGLMAALPERGLISLLLKKDNGGEVARRLIFPLIGIPLFLGWLRVYAENFGFVDPAFGAAIRTLAEIGLFVGLLWWTCNSISQHAQVARSASRALQESEERFSLFMESLPGLAWIKSSEGSYIYANTSALKAFQTTREDLYGKKDEEVFPADTAARFVANDHLALQNPEGVHVVETLPGPDGTVISSVVSKFQIPAEEGHPGYLGGIAIDISDRLKAEEALKEAYRRKDEFLATLAHELRNPLTPIRYAVQIFRDTPEDERKTHWALDVIDRQVKHMARLLEDLMDASRILHGKLTLRSEVVELSRILDNAIETSRPLLDSGGQVLRVHTPPNPVLLNGDPVRLSQIFSNLLNNAAKYTPAGTVVEITVKSLSGKVKIILKDNGPGIPEHVLPVLFDMFSQGKPPGSGGHGGLGVGLALVRGLVELHGGHVEVLSGNQHPGSEFVVHLPQLESSSTDSNRVDPAAGFPDQKKRRILVADDLRDSADSVAMYFRVNGHEVQTAYDGEQALAAARAFHPDLILLDIGMPKMNGLEVCKKIREEPWGRNAQMVAITGWGQETDKVRSVEAGFDRHLVKPVDISDLLSLLIARETSGSGRQGRI